MGWEQSKCNRCSEVLPEDRKSFESICNTSKSMYGYM